MLDAAIMRQHFGQRQPVVQIIPDGIGAVEIELLLTLAKHQQTGNVINLRIHHHHGSDAGIANRARRLERRI